MLDSQPSRTTQESADRLADALKDYTRSLKKVKRRYIWTLGSVIALALTLILGLKFNHDSNVDRCVAGNALRIELNDKFQNLADILISAGTGDTPEGQEVILIFEEDFSTRDCSEINWLG